MKEDLKSKQMLDFRKKCTICMILKKYYNYQYDLNFIIYVDEAMNIDKKFINIVNLLRFAPNYINIIKSTSFVPDIDTMPFINFYVFPLTEKGLKITKELNEDVASLSKNINILDIVKEFTNDKMIFNKIVDSLDEKSVIYISQSDYNDTIEYMMRMGFHDYNYDSFLKFCNLCYITNDEEDN